MPYAEDQIIKDPLFNNIKRRTKAVAAGKGITYKRALYLALVDWVALHDGDNTSTSDSTLIV